MICPSTGNKFFCRISSFWLEEMVFTFYNKINSFWLIQRVLLGNGNQFLFRITSFRLVEQFVGLGKLFVYKNTLFFLDFKISIQQLI